MLFVLSSSLSSEASKYLIKSYDLQECKSISGSVWAMVQDTSGILYFGSDNGLTIFDGAKWAYVDGLQTPIRSLSIANNGQVFYGSVDDFGLIMKDEEKGIYLISLKTKMENPISFSDIWSINVCQNQIFFQSKDHVFIYENDQVREIPVDNSYHRAGVLSGQFVLNQQNTGLSVYDGQGFKLLPNASFFKDFIISAFIDLTDNECLIFTRRNGVFKYNWLNGNITSVFHKSTNTNEILKKANVYHAIKLPDGNLAVATLYSGTFIINHHGFIEKKLNRISGSIENTNYFLGISNNSNIWICTANGLSVFNINSPFLFWDYSSGLDGIVLSIEAFKEKLYVGTFNGLFIRVNEEKPGTSIQNKFSKLISSDIWDISKVSIDGNDLLYIASGQGLYYIKDELLFEETKGELVHKIIQSKINENILYVFYRDKIDIYKWDSKRFVFAYSIEKVLFNFRTAIEDESGFLWVGTRMNVVHRFNVDEIIKACLMNDRSILKTESWDHQIFDFDYFVADVFDFHGKPVVNANGIYEFSYEKNQFHKSNTFNNKGADLPKISAFVEDSYQNIWIGGSNILIRQPEGSYELHQMPFKHLKDLFSSFVFKPESNGKMWIGGNRGLYLFDNMAEKPSMQSEVLIRKLTLNDKFRIYPQPNADLPENLSKTIGKEIVQSHQKISIDFALPYFEDEKNTLYSYYLDGYQNEWSPWSIKSSVDFNNLKPGDYTFNVRAKNIFDEETPITSLSFLVPRPWYRQIVFFIVLGILFIILIYFLIQRISEIKMQKQLRIEEIIQIRLKEERFLNVISDIKTEPRKGEHENQNFQTNSDQFSVRDSEFLKKALKVIDDNMDNPGFDVKMFAGNMGMSQAKLYRKLNALVGMSITKFIRNTRLKKAAQLLWETDSSISEVAYKTGFNTPGYFTKCFSQEFGITPSDFLVSDRKNV